MGVPTCVTEELLLQNKEVLEASRMTKWNTEKQQAEPTNMVKIVLVGKQHPVIFTRGYGSFRLRPFVSRPLQCFTARSLATRPGPAGPRSIPAGTARDDNASTQCKDNGTRTLKCVNCGQGHAATSRLCPKKLEAESKVKPAHKVSTTKQVNRIPAPIPLKNAWASLTIQEVGKQSSTQQTTTIGEPIEVSTKPKHTVRNSNHFRTGNQNRNGSVRPSTSYQCLDKTIRTSMMEFPVAMSANRSLSGHWPSKTHQSASYKQYANKRGTIHDVLETIQIALTGANISIKEDFYLGTLV